MGAVRVLGHVKACADPGRYAGWPANHGIWRWVDEILAGFQIEHYKEQAGHTIDWTQPIRKVFARSRDGGETWTLEDTLPDALDNLVDRPGAPDTPHHPARVRRMAARRGTLWRGSGRRRSMVLPSCPHRRAWHTAIFW